ncbi:hypothetical protein [Salipaludibacillus daqingensis]|uniref:hypothetical protein n=1 Tax=Salipaludibacillus daqingensis TaxID=3041001 RepID=UPI0024732F1C|nr:hypothetical protein [Salipaludibacillus daqingensis]
METLKYSESMKVDKQTVVIPFRFSCLPLKKLALINFEKKPDTHYIALEPQYFDDLTYGHAYRVIAYRRDGYVDVYDDMNLMDDKDDSFDVTGKGLCERKKVGMEHTKFEKENDQIFLSFQFTDKYGRQIRVEITEHTSKKTNGINLLAPVGSSTENPSYLPLFFLYDFDFVRKRKTKAKVIIDGNPITIDNFPYPLAKDFQLRYYTRYSEDCQIIEFANATNEVLKEYTADANRKVVSDSLEYQFGEDRSLEKILLKDSNHDLIVEFTGGFPDVRSLMNPSDFKGTFKISADEKMGYVSGEYSVRREDSSVTIELIPSDGWAAIPNSLFTKMMFSKKSLFCNWPKTYRYIQQINLTTLESSSRWERIK